MVVTSPSASITVAAVSPSTRTERPAQRKARADRFTTAYLWANNFFDDECPLNRTLRSGCRSCTRLSGFLSPNEPLVTCFSPDKHPVGLRYSMQHI